MKYLLILILSFVANLAIAQDFDNDYTPLKPEGKIPKAITTTSTEKYERDKEKISRSDKRKTRKDKDKFFLQNNFVIDEMMKSGRVLFNDPLSIYVNKVADNLLANQPELKEKLKFYVIKSEAVNAFATDRGTIFINVGLIARLEDEAQLAYVLAHEIVHYKENHNIQTFIEYAEIERESNYRRSKNYERLLEKNNYSKSLETEADKNGLEIFLSSKYSTESLRGVFDILGKAHLPYTNVPFDFAYLETPEITFPSIYDLKEIKEIEAYEEDSEESTHPSVRERRSDLLLSLSGKSTDNKSLFLVSETEFEKARTIARFEICQILLQSHRYTAAIYHTFSLSKDYPNNQFLRKTLAKSLYGLAQYKNVERYDEVMPYGFDNYQGEIQKVYHLFEKIEATELNVLAAAHLWKAHKDFPTSKGLELMTKDMFEDLVIYQVEKPKEFFKKERAADLPAEDVSFDKFGLGKLIEDEQVQEWFENGEKYRKKFADDEAFYATRKGQRKRNKEYKRDLRKGKSLGIDKAVFINPTYISIDARKKTPFQYLKGEERQGEFEDWIKESGDKLDLKTKVLDVNGLSKRSKAEEYADIIVMNEWFDEILTNDMYMINSNYDEAMKVAEKYGTNYFVYTGTVSYRANSTLFLRLLGMSLFIYYPPLAAKALLTSDHEALHFSLVFNVQQNETIMTNANLTKYKDKDKIIQQNLYWSMLQMKRKAKN